MNRITEMLGIKYPIIQGAMQDVAKADWWQLFLMLAG